MICLDTNVAIGLLKETPALLLDRFWKEASRDAICLPIIALFELRYGVAKSEHRQRNAQRLEDLFTFPLSVLRFEEADAEHAADIRADLKRWGTPIGPYDVLIAALARSHAGHCQHARVRPRPAPCTGRLDGGHLTLLGMPIGNTALTNRARAAFRLRLPPAPMVSALRLP